MPLYLSSPHYRIPLPNGWKVVQQIPVPEASGMHDEQLRVMLHSHSGTVAGDDLSAALQLLKKEQLQAFADFRSSGEYEPVGTLKVLQETSESSISQQTYQATKLPQLVVLFGVIANRQSLILRYEGLPSQIMSLMAVQQAVKQMEWLQPSVRTAPMPSTTPVVAAPLAQVTPAESKARRYTSFLKSKKPAFQVDRLMPWVTSKALVRQQSELTDRPLTRPFVEDLVIAYIEAPTPSQPDIRWVTHSELETLQLDAKALHELAMNQLNSLLPRVQFVGAPTKFTATCGEWLGPTLMLKTSFWDKLERTKLRMPSGLTCNVQDFGQIMVAVPSMGKLVGGLSSLGGTRGHLLDQLTQSGDAAPVSTHVYIRQAQAWQVFREEEANSTIR